MMQTEILKRANDNTEFENTEQDWADPLALPRRILPDVPALPEELIPDPLRAGLKDIAWRMQVALEPVAIAALVTISSLIGSSCRVRPKQLDDWTVVPNLYGWSINYPGELKTPILKAASISLLRPLAAGARETHKEEKIRSEAQKAVYEARKAALKEQMKNAAKPAKKNTQLLDSIDIELLASKYEKLEEPQEKPLKRYSANSCTVQAIQVIQADNPRGILMIADELVRLFRNWDSPGHESDRDYFLEAWDGGVPFDHDTVSRGNTYVPCNTLSVLGNTTPDKLREYLIDANTGNDDGFPQRFQMGVFPAKGAWQWVDQKPDAEAAEYIYKLLKIIDELDYGAIGAQLDGAGQYHYLRFAPEATENVFKPWYTELKTVSIPNEGNLLIAEHLAKYPSLLASLALIFCIIRTVHSGLPQATISQVDAELAAAWCDFLELHARKIYALLDDAKTLAIQALDKRILMGTVDDGFLARDIRRKNWQHLPNTLVDYACDKLVELRRLKKEEIEPTNKGGRRTYRYWINPKLQVFTEDIEGGESDE